jgi:hypothetical protein
MTDHRAHTPSNADDVPGVAGRVGVVPEATDADATFRVAPTTRRRRMASDPAYWRDTDADTDSEVDVEIPESLNYTRDRVRMAPILAGMAAALTTLLLMSLLGLAVGLTVVNAGTAAAEGNVPDGLGRTAAMWGALSAVLAFLLGGWVAGRSAAVFDRQWGALNGALVFMVAIPVILWLASQGVGPVLGNIGSFVGNLIPDPAALRDAAPIDVTRAAERARNTAWGTLGGALLGLAAATLGGMYGTRRELEVDTKTGRVSD